MNNKALAVLEELKEGLAEERDGLFPLDRDFFEWAEKMIDRVEDEILSQVCSASRCI